MYLRDLGNTEVGGFGISAEDNQLLIEDVLLIGQQTTVVSVQFDDEGVADYFDEQVDAGLPPERFLRVWLHTHPGDSAQPSRTDEETFTRVFGQCDWAVMAILAQGGETYARLHYGVGPGGEFEIPVCVDYTVPFPAADPDAWEKEYERCVKPIDVWHKPPAIVTDPWDWPEYLETEDAIFLEDGRFHDSDEFGSLFAAAGACAAGKTDGPDGDCDRCGGDRQAGRHTTGRAGCPAVAVD